MVSILVVEDSKAMREVISMTLSNAGHEVTTASDGNEGESTANDGNFDLIITDLYMPGQNGINLINNLKTTVKYKNTPFIIVTTENTDEMKEKSKGVGASGWLTKPINSTRLLTAVSKTLDKYGLEG